MFIDKEEVDIQKNEGMVYIYFSNKEINAVRIIKSEEYNNNRGVIEKEAYRHIVRGDKSSCYFNFFSY